MCKPQQAILHAGKHVKCNYYAGFKKKNVYKSYPSQSSLMTHKKCMIVSEPRMTPPSSCISSS